MHYNPLISQFWLTVIIIASLAMTILIVFASSKLRESRYRYPILFLRIAVIGILSFILCNPARIKQQESGEQILKDVLLLDYSASMSLETPNSRYAQIANILKNVESENQRKLVCYSFDSVASRLDTFYTIFSKQPKGDQTNLAQAIQQVISAENGNTIRNILVCSDGQMTDKAKLEQAILQTRRFEIPVSVCGIGQETALFNVEIKVCEANLYALPNSVVPVKVMVETKGSLNEAYELRLQNSSNEVLDSKSGQLKDGITELTLKLKTGLNSEKYRVEFVPLPGELTAADNVADFELKVSDPKIRVLYMEGTNENYNKSTDYSGGRWPAYRFINDACEKTGRIEVEPYVVNVQRSVGGEIYHAETRKKGYPKTKEEIFSYDVVICSDINRFIFNDDQLKWTQEMVEKNGGGFCMIGGITSFGSGGYDKTIWEKMIPVDMETSGNSYARVTPSFPAKNIDHPIWKFDDDKEKNIEIIQSHPSFSGTNLVSRAKPAATVLAYWKNGGNMPLICVQPYGKGRSMAFTSDAAGGWGEGYQNGWGPTRGSNAYYQKFWVNAVMWLAENSLAGRQHRLRCNPNKASYSPGDKIELDAEVSATEEEYILETKFLATSSRPEKMKFDKTRQTYSAVRDVPANFKEDMLTLVCSAKKMNGDLFAADTLRLPIKRVNAEYLNPNPDFNSLEKLMTLTGGRNLEDASDINSLLGGNNRKAEKSEEYEKIPLWDKWWLWLIVVALMGIEWVIRKFRL